MRLGQLARKLDISTSDIVSLLKEHNIEINNHPNVKIEGEREAIVIEEYGFPELELPTETVFADKSQAEEKQIVIQDQPTPDNFDLQSNVPVAQNEKEDVVIQQKANPIDHAEEVAAIEQEQSLVENEKEDTAIEQEDNLIDNDEEFAVIEQEDNPIDNEEELIEKEVAAPVPEQKLLIEEKIDTDLTIEEEKSAIIDPSNEPSEEEGTEVDDVIRAPKIELVGLKVVGKIDLPEPKIKEEKPVEPRTKRSATNGRRESNDEEKEARRIRNREARERRALKAEEKEREERVERDRKSKEVFYRQKLADEAKAKKGRKPKKKKEVIVAQKVKEEPQPKTLLGKFWKWLNT
ncbi:MAG: hypothetical protein ACI93L_003103 [Cyclobacteriaceae bacterium]|jgi:hypothetical protein